MAELVADAELAVEAATEEETATEELDILEYGLVLPTGQVAWSQWQGRLFITPQDRQAMLDALRETAPQVGLDVDAYVNQFYWVTRIVHVVKTYSTAEPEAYPITAPEFLAGDNA